MHATTRTYRWITRAIAITLIVPILGTSLFLMSPSTSAQNEPGTQVNVQLLLDSSGSMAEETNTGEPRIDAAKRVLNDVIEVQSIDPLPANFASLEVNLLIRQTAF